MRKTLLTALALLFFGSTANGQDLLITGIIDGPLSGQPKAVELYAVNAVADLSTYEVAVYANGSATSTGSTTLSASATAGQYIYVADQADGFTDFFGFAPDIDGNLSVNGNDAVGLLNNGTLIDAYGAIGTDGTGMNWEYTDGWAYRQGGSNANPSFNAGNWTFSGPNALDGQTTNAGATNPMPIQTYSPTGVVATTVTFLEGASSVAEGDAGTSQAVITIRANNPSTTAPTVATVEISGTATRGVDYNILNYTPDPNSRITVTFPAGSEDPSTDIVLEVIGDTDDEGAESVIFDIQTVSGGESAGAGSPNVKTVSILNDDALAPASLVINEIDPDQFGGDDGEFIELFGTPGASLDGYVIVLYNGSDDRSYDAFDLDGMTLDANGYFLLCGNATIPNCGAPASADNFMIASNNFLQNGADAVALYTANAADFPNDTDLTMTGLVDAIVYGTNDSDDTALLNGLGETVQYNDEDDETNPTSIQRFPDGSENIVVDFIQTPGASNLPVELVSFTAAVTGDAVSLAWETASEQNNSGFDVEQFDAATESFVRVGFVEGFGTTLEAQAYGFEVTGLSAGTHRFRLKQIDYDGAFSYSPEVEVAVEMPGSYVMSEAYPNPLRGSATLSLSVKTAQDVEVAAFDVLGRKVATLFSGRMDAGSAQALTLDAANLSAGLYVIRAEGERFVATRTATVVR
jgi:hypothetical protein